jgi:toxin ParE1/3/4
VTCITYTEDAAQDFEEIYRHIAEDNPAAAQKHRQNLKQRCESLLHQPRMGRKRDEVRTGWRSVTEGDYVILYRIVDEAVPIRLRHTPTTCRVSRLRNQGRRYCRQRMYVPTG